ncbi:MAG TPA: hypothetical protein VF163_16440, partial [Micromonosporaceae bacterium]
IAEQGIDVLVRHGAVMLTGDVESQARRDEIARRVGELLPGLPVRNDIVIISTQPPEEPEELP